MNTTLRIINLRFNELTDTGAIALGATLRMNSALTELDVGGNKYNFYIFSTNLLIYLTCFLYILIFRNRIGNEGAEAIAAGLCENNTLLKLNLRSNLIGDAGAMAIAECLKR